MAEPHVISGLKAKREEIRRAVSESEAKIKTARADLATIIEALRIFGDGEAKTYAKPAPLFFRGELARIVFDALRDAPDGLDTKELSAIVMRSKGLDHTDAALSKTIAYRVGIAMQRYLAKGQVQHGEIRRGVRVWLRSAD